MDALTEWRAKRAEEDALLAETAPDPTRSPSLQEQLIKNSRGAPTPCLANAITFFRLHADWQDVPYFDEFALATWVRHAPPWEGKGIVNRKWTSNDDALAANWLQHEGIAVGPDVAAQAIEVVARDAAFHPVRDYLNGLVWDGERRVPTWLSQYLGVAPSKYAMAVGQNFLISAVARILQPGCKADCMLIIEGAQGIGKSRAVHALAGQWFSDELSDIGSKDASLQLGGNWIFELSELDATQRSDITALKAFLSRRNDRFRPPYGRRVIEAPRQCVFIGTTNAEGYLRDETGARRFWPVKATKIFPGQIEKDRDQLWAEAVELYQNGTHWWIEDAVIAAAARGEQDARYASDPWDDKVAQHIRNLSDTSIADILTDVFHIEAAHWKQADQNRVARALTSMGWIKYQQRIGERRQWRYRRQEG